MNENPVTVNPCPSHPSSAALSYITERLGCIEPRPGTTSSGIEYTTEPSLVTEKASAIFPATTVGEGGRALGIPIEPGSAQSPDDDGPFLNQGSRCMNGAAESLHATATRTHASASSAAGAGVFRGLNRWVRESQARAFGVER